MMTPEEYQNIFHWYKKDVSKDESQVEDNKQQSTVEIEVHNQQHLSDAIKLDQEFNEFLKLTTHKPIKSKITRKKGRNTKHQNIRTNDHRITQNNNIRSDDRAIEREFPYIILPNKEKKSVDKKKKLILIYTALHRSEEWYNLPQSKLKGYLKRTKCTTSNCRVTYDKDLFSKADAVIFHERNMLSIGLLNRLSSRRYRPRSQRWIFFTSETPKNTEDGVIPYNGFFNWTMTYKKDSDIYLPYLQYRKLKKKARRPDPNFNYAKGKSRSIAWLVGNCDFEFRMEFVHALEQLTTVYVGGYCRDDFRNKIICTRWCNQSVLDDYKFYLSLENGICTDYISEKYWKYLEQGLVPIVLGGANYSDPRLAIPGSFIDATKFKSVKDLADYINYLDQNDTAYNEYFKWKQKYKIWHPLEGDWPFESYFLCKICGMLHQNLPIKIYDYLSDFWSVENDCEIPEKEMRKRINFTGYNWEDRHRRAEKQALIDAAHIPKDFDEEEHDNEFNDEFSDDLA